MTRAKPTITVNMTKTFLVKAFCKYSNETVSNKLAIQLRLMHAVIAGPLASCLNTSVAYTNGIGPFENLFD
jgi:hypothetical protein